MTAGPAALASFPIAALPDVETLLDALPLPILLLDPAGLLRRVNPAGEALFAQSAAHLEGRPLAELIAADSPLQALADQARGGGAPVSDHNLVISGPRLAPREVRVDAAPLSGRPGWVLLAIAERALAGALDRQRQQREAVRPLHGMAALLAHEIKNPLSGIRGAAQLLEGDLPESNRELTRLIREEVDRIRGLVDRMEMFAEPGFTALGALNIHEVLDHVRRIAESGFAADRRIVADYDPSLPDVAGHRDLLIQLFLNLVKNAAEATEPGRGRITLSTRYRQGAKLAGGAAGQRAHLPLVVTVADNGAGVPAALKSQIFDPFVSGRNGGKGLGLALAAKIVGDHGGAIEFESEPGRTAFAVLLPIATEAAR